MVYSRQRSVQMNSECENTGIDRNDTDAAPRAME